MPRELQSIKVRSNHFTAYSLLTEGFKVSSFFSDDPSLQLNQALEYWISLCCLISMTKYVLSTKGSIPVPC